MLKFSKTERKDKWSVASMESAMTYEDTPYKTTVYRQSSIGMVQNTPSQDEYKAAILKSMTNKELRGHVIPDLHPETENIVITHDIKLSRKKESRKTSIDQPINQKTKKDTARKVESLPVIEVTTLDVKYGDLKWKKPEYKIEQTKGLSSLDIEENYCTPVPRKRVQQPPPRKISTNEKEIRKDYTKNFPDDSNGLRSFGYFENSYFESSQKNINHSRWSSNTSSDDHFRLNSTASSDMISEETKSISSNCSNKSKESIGSMFRFHGMRRHVKRIVKKRDRKKSKITEELQSVSIPDFSSDDDDEETSQETVDSSNKHKTHIKDLTVSQLNGCKDDYNHISHGHNTQDVDKIIDDQKHGLTITLLDQFNNNTTHNIQGFHTKTNEYTTIDDQRNMRYQYDPVNHIETNNILGLQDSTKGIKNDEQDSPLSSIKTRESSTTSLICSDRSFSDASDTVNEMVDMKKTTNRRRDLVHQYLFRSKQQFDYQQENIPVDNRTVAYTKSFETYHNVPDTTNINSILKADLLIKIFSYFNTNELCQLSKVCKTWSQLHLSPLLWRKISIIDYQKDIDGVMNIILQRLSFHLTFACLNVQLIYLPGCSQLTDQALQLIALRCPELKSIEIPNCSKVTGSGVSEILANCPNLAYLNLNGCESLRTFEFTENSGTQFGQTASLLELRYLDLSECTSLQDDSLRSITSCASFLEYIYLRRCDSISNDGLEAIAMNCHNLKEISLNECYNVSDIGVMKLLKHCIYLQYISLAKCTVGDVTIKAIAKYSRSLRHLNLHECEAISDNGIVDIANICTRLRSIDISKCPHVTNVSLFALSQCKHLRRLSVKECINVNDSGIRKIVTHCKLLRHLDLRKCTLSYETFLYIKQRLPNCKVQHNFHHVF